MSDHPSPDSPEGLSLPHRLVHWRMRNGYSEDQAAAVLGVSQATISRWESGEASPQAKRLPQLAKELGLTVRQVYNLKHGLPVDAEVTVGSIIEDQQRMRLQLQELARSVDRLAEAVNRLQQLQPVD